MLFVRPSNLWRTTPFRLTVLNGVVFALGIMGVLALIYWQTAVYVGDQMDDIVMTEAALLGRSDAASLPGRIDQAVGSDTRAVEYYGLFSAEGVWITGNVHAIPAGFKADGRTHELRTPGFQPGARAMMTQTPWGEMLFIGHDAKVLSGLRAIILRALLLSGALILMLGLAAAAAASLSPLRRIEQLRGATRAALKGELGVRLPISRRRDEMDMLAGLANAMMDETERLLWEVKSIGDNVAHDLRTPLNRLRASLYRLSREDRLEETSRAMAESALAEADELLARFRALLRIGEIERRDRQAGFGPVDLQDVLRHVLELHEPLAEDRGIALLAELSPEAPSVSADAGLLFEAVSNLVDNALKFTPPGGKVIVRLEKGAQGPRIQVIDSGSGLPEDEREAVLQRFYRAQRTRGTPGSGLGLSIVTAIARLHHFTLSLSDAAPGLRVTLDCWPRQLED